jgi:hypothetical protein
LLGFGFRGDGGLFEVKEETEERDFSGEHGVDEGAGDGVLAFAGVGEKGLGEAAALPGAGGRGGGFEVVVVGGVGGGDGVVDVVEARVGHGGSWGR